MKAYTTVPKAPIVEAILDIQVEPAEGMNIGAASIPLILREMSIKQGQWFWALKSITNEDPVKPEHRGIVAEMSRDWLQWGKDRGYID